MDSITDNFIMVSTREDGNSFFIDTLARPQGGSEVIATVGSFTDQGVAQKPFLANHPLSSKISNRLSNFQGHGLVGT
jgi:hypothetical protein